MGPQQRAISSSSSSPPQSPPLIVVTDHLHRSPSSSPIIIAILAYHPSNYQVLSRPESTPSRSRSLSRRRSSPGTTRSFAGFATRRIRARKLPKLWCQTMLRSSGPRAARLEPSYFKSWLSSRATRTPYTSKCQFCGLCSGQYRTSAVRILCQ